MELKREPAKTKNRSIRSGDNSMSFGGVFRARSLNRDGDIMSWETCPNCNGTGDNYGIECCICGGHGGWYEE